MKKRITFIMIVVAGLSLTLPAYGFSWSNGYYYGYRGGCCYGNGWGVGAAIAGGLVAALLVGTIIADQGRRSPPPAPVPDPHAAYAYPDPAFTAKYGPETTKEAPPGEWVLVPGQWTGSVWVPEHQVWVARDDGSSKQ
ncbi:MAG TPA: hypothetical protein VGJ94_06355 [Syntrophorhabdaceae bacterium]|jgi:hypothetical protein